MSDKDDVKWTATVRDVLTDAERDSLVAGGGPTSPIVVELCGPNDEEHKFAIGVEAFWAMWAACRKFVDAQLNTGDTHA